MASSTSGSDSASLSAGMRTSTITSLVSGGGQNLPHHDQHLGEDQEHDRDFEQERVTLPRQIDEQHQVVLKHAQLGVERAIAIFDLEHLAHGVPQAIELLVLPGRVR